MIVRKAAGALVYCSIIGIGAGTFAGWGLDSLQANYSTADRADSRSDPLDLQSTNSTAKGDRLAALPSAPVQPFALRFDDRLLLALMPPAESPAPAAEPVTPAAEPAPRQATGARPAAVPEKPKRASAPSNAILDDGQIASIKSRLRLTSQQAQYWPAVEAALRDVARQQAIDARKRHPHKPPPPLDVNSAEVQRLIQAAMPLLQRLREDQKREVRTLVRVLGLTTVASYI